MSLSKELTSDTNCLLNYSQKKFNKQLFGQEFDYPSTFNPEYLLFVLPIYKKEEEAAVENLNNNLSQLKQDMFKLSSNFLSDFLLNEEDSLF
ncbi:MAG: hypothetical protein WAT92_02730 [Saprospiraceae bacterium]